MVPDRPAPDHRSAPDAAVTLAAAGDWPAIWPIWSSVVAAGDSYLYDPQTQQDEARRIWLKPAPAAVYVARAPDGAVVATALLQPNQPGLGSHVANAAFMVDPSRRSQGYGRQLAAFVIDEAGRQGYRAMQFNAVRSDNPTALALWQSLGFKEIGRVPRGCALPTGTWADLLILFREL